ncbi:(2Fe-2S)-binding protein [Roseibium sp. RKSG952]|uniref:(2Fe-2S)-binding protein n=1 Tax=Roseibium sp. RKSG952 TaxID=2529384 RepID=UPI0012BCFEF9|nr:(2Fe-2S)-binding protein [Roseibium sp. RKSG952]MTI00663.1 (2Fe-2S)-binding protein [Roseibium sp. RKSG952]
MTRSTITVTVNGTPQGPHEVPDAMRMVDYLNDTLGLTGTKFSCGIGICHACVVIVDQPDGTSRTERTCIQGAAAFDGKSIRTIEGHAKNGKLSPVQQAYVDHFSFQCGYCTSGFVNEATVLLENLKKSPIAKADVETAIEEAMGNHICRCTGYVRYFQALKDLILNQNGLTREG